MCKDSLQSRSLLGRIFCHRNTLLQQWFEHKSALDIRHIAGCRSQICNNQVRMLQNKKEILSLFWTITQVQCMHHPIDKGYTDVPTQGLLSIGLCNMTSAAHRQYRNWLSLIVQNIFKNGFHNVFSRQTNYSTNVMQCEIFSLSLREMET